MKNTMKKAISVGLAGTLLLTCLTGCGAVADAVATDAYAAEAEQITQAASTLLRTHSDTEGKEETVYVIADAAGNPTETIVSAWLKNPDGADTLEDVSDLSDIVNTKGDETYSEAAGGRLTWAANGNDIYYQGTTDRKLPVTTSITYELDGRAVSAEELAGASGHLTITFDYRNNTAEKREVGGETVTLYQPFVVVSGLALDGDAASNITVTNGRVVNTGDRSIVLGMAMPGLKESLGLDTMKNRDGEPADIDLPERVVIEADVRDFELLTTVTVISNDLLGELDLDDVDTVEELGDAMDELTDASARLVDGTAELYDGVEELSNGTADLTDGIARLDDGAGSLKSGAEELSGGASQLADGAASAAEGAAALSAGAAQVDDGARQISGNMSALSSGISAARDGAAGLESGLARMRVSVAGLPAGTDALYQGTLLVRSALKSDEVQSLYGGAMAIEAGAAAVSAGLTGDGSILTAADGIASGAQQLAAGADGISAAASQLLAALDGAMAQAGGAVAKLSALGIDVSGYMDQANAARDALVQIKAGADAISAGLAGDGMSIYNAANGISAGAQGLDGGVKQIGAGARSLETGIDTIVSEENLGAILAGLSELSESSETLVSGVDQLAAGASLLTEGIGTAADGAAALDSGAARLTAGTAQVSSGAAALETGAGTLADGAAGAAAGAAKLASGAGELKDGTSRLRDGGTALTDGVTQLLDGARELRDGMTEFDEEGIQALSELVEDDAQTLIDRLKAVQALGREYTSFDGAQGAYPGSVRFIVRTESIGK